jgi:hypothetical protein
VRDVGGLGHRPALVEVHEHDLGGDAAEHERVRGGLPQTRAYVTFTASP